LQKQLIGHLFSDEIINCQLVDYFWGIIMDQNYDCDIHLDKYGQPDVNYYINEVKRLRDLAISQLIHDIGEWLKMSFGKQHELPLRPSL